MLLTYFSKDLIIKLIEFDDKFEWRARDEETLSSSADFMCEWMYCIEVTSFGIEM